METTNNTRDQIFTARTPADVLALVTAHEGQPTVSGLHAWVNTVLGPYHIPADVNAGCKR